MEHFEIWFGSLVVGMGLIAVAIAGLLHLVLGRGPRRLPDLRAALGTPLIIGIVFIVLGGSFAGAKLWRLQVEQRVLANGVMARAFVHGPEQSLMRLDGRFLWRVRYQYPDQTGLAHEGWSGLMTAEEAQAWRSADVALVRFDPNHPSTSVWLGRREESR